jgi:hypothetical protein
MTDFDYRPQAGFAINWMVCISGYDDAIDGDYPEMLRRLSDVEALIEDLVDEYSDESDASIVRVHGSHGWRVFTWDNGAVHRYEWKYHLFDLRCHQCESPDADLYMVHDEVWASSGLDGWVCFRCLEGAIGRRLVPTDFKPDLPANTDDTYHGPELRERIGLP